MVSSQNRKCFMNLKNSNMKSTEYKYLRFVRYKDIEYWDLKRNLCSSFKSKYNIAKLGNFIQEENKKFDISEPDKQYGILGVNNQTGVFDAYIEKGSNIKQKYKKMDVDWIAYNPYRINVGSIGIKKPVHQYDYISPAYVVFSCEPSLYPDYLYLTMKTPLFNKIIKDNTTGSVRQNLSFDVLKSLSIPVPEYSEQQRLVKKYYDKLQQAKVCETQAVRVDVDTEDYLLDELGIIKNDYNQSETVESYAAEPQVEYVITQQQNYDRSDTCVWGDEIKKEYRYLKFVRFKDVDRWDVYNVETSVINRIKRSKYPTVSIGNHYAFVQRRWDKKENEFKYVELGAIDPLNGILYAESMQTSKAPSRATQRIKTGDLIVGTTRPYLKKFAIVNEKYNDCVCSSGFQVIEPRDSYNLSFLCEYLKTQVAIEQFGLYMSGALYPAITNKDIKKVIIPLPPIDVQNAIVEHINKKKEQIKLLKKQAGNLRKEALEEFEKEIFE